MSTSLDQMWFWHQLHDNTENWKTRAVANKQIERLERKYAPIGMSA